jgi:hypothetical protein
MNKTQKKKFKDTKLGQWLKIKAPELLGQVGDFLPDSGTLGIVKRGISILSPDDQKEGIEEIKKVERKLTEIDLENARIDLEILKTKLSDRDSARSREIESIKIGNKSALMYVLGFGMLGCYIGLLISLIFLNIPEQNKDQLIHMEGIMEGGLLAMISYYFGDSQRSEKK